MDKELKGMNKGEIVLYELLEVANADDIEENLIEVFYEDGNGNEGSVDRDITDICQEAANYIEQLEQQLSDLSKRELYFKLETGEYISVDLIDEYADNLIKENKGE